jgi:hypothetical protein
MDATSVADLQRAFASAEAPTTGMGECGLCDCALGDDDPIVEVALSPGTDDPASLLCPSCYEYVVGDVGLTPLRVFKAGPRRRVVFPAPADGAE